MAAENAQIEDGDTVAIWGCGPVGQFAIRSALMMGAGRVIAIDEVPERLAMAEAGGAETIDFSEVDVYDELMARTNKRGPDSCIDAVGCEASGHGAADAVLDKVKAAALLATDRVHVLREAIMCCRKGGTISIPGVYVGMGDKLPIGAAMNKGLTIKMGQTHVQAYTKPLAREDRGGRNRPELRRHFALRVSKTRRRCTRNFATRRMASSRSCCDPAGRSLQRAVWGKATGMSAGDNRHEPTSGAWICLSEDPAMPVVHRSATEAAMSGK